METILLSFDDIQQQYGYCMQYGHNLDGSECVEDFEIFLRRNYTQVYDSNLNFVGYEKADYEAYL